MRQCFYQNGAFPTLYFDMLTNEIEGKDAKQTCQAVNLLRQQRQPVTSASHS